MQSESKYKLVNIQKLERKGQPNTTHLSHSNLIAKLNKPTREQFMQQRKNGSKQGQQQIYCYKDTGPSQEKKQRIQTEHHSFFSSFFIPYNHHGDVVLVPDDVWLMISLFLSKYIDANAEKLRSQFVTHKGQKQLRINEYANSVEESLKMQKEWDYFFNEIIKQIDKNTVKGTVQALSCNFTTTSQLYKLISTSIIMSSFKKYFTYTRGICMCGINNVYFEGTREDWVKVLDKLNFLVKYDVDGKLKEYISHMTTVLEKFISTYDGKPDVNWWNTIMTSQEVRVGSGGDTIQYVQGWILHFYGIYHRIDIDKIPQTLVKVPIKLINELTGTEKDLEMLVDWVSVSKVEQFGYKPDIGMCIIERGRQQIK